MEAAPHISIGGGLVGNFGFISPLLKEIPGFRSMFSGYFPEKWRYFRGPLKVGEISGSLPGEKLRGWGWKVPENPARVWEGKRLADLWQRFFVELAEKEIKVIGLDAGRTFCPPGLFRSQPDVPGVSDGKALELLFFMNRFRSILRNYEITPQKAKALVIWEEGNLGVTCARAIAREVRFLTLVSPNARILEIAAEIILSETGVSPQVFVDLPSDYRGAKIVVKCGRVAKYQLPRVTRRVIWCELFQSFPSLSSMNFALPVTAANQVGKLPLYPALAEVILRSGFGLQSGFWHGSDLPLERVVKLAVVFKELGIDLTI
jgi:hypothetical protein